MRRIVLTGLTAALAACNTATPPAGSPPADSPPTSAPPAVVLAASPSTVTSSAATLRLSANVSNFSAARVEFYDGPNLVRSDAESPFEFYTQFASTDNGPHEFRAVAVSSNNQNANSNVVTVEVNILASTGGASLSGRVLTPFVAASATASALGIPAAAELVPGEVLVRFRPGASVEQVARALSLSAAGRPGGRVQRLRDERLAGGSQLVRAASTGAAGTLALLATLRGRPDVEYAEPNYVRRASLVPTDPEYAGTAGAGLTAGQRWHYEDAKLPAAWDEATGSGVTVAVLDSGIAPNHPDFNCQVFGGSKIAPGLDLVDGDTTPFDPGGAGGYHGTHVAGTIGACAGGSNVGGLGVAYGARLLPVRVLDGDGSGTDADIIDGAMWAAGITVQGLPANPNPAQVLNLSLGGPGESAAVRDAFARIVRETGAIVVVAAGNSNADAASFTPAGVEGVISVAAAGPNRKRAAYSNYGAAVDILAPGGDSSPGVTSPNQIVSTVGGTAGYAGMEGTSMAAPHVAGIVALMIDANPGLAWNWWRATYYLQTTADAAGLSDCSVGCGAGMVDAHAAVLAARAGAPVPAGLLVEGSAAFGFSEGATKELTVLNYGDAAASFSALASLPVSVDPGSGTVPVGGTAVLTLSLARTDGDPDGGFIKQLELSQGLQKLQHPVTYRTGSGAFDAGAVQLELYRRKPCPDVTDYCLERASTVAHGLGYPYGFGSLPSGGYALLAYTDADSDGITEYVALEYLLLDAGQAFTGADLELQPASLMLGQGLLSRMPRR